MKALHYFDDPEAAKADDLLRLCIRRGYVPDRCRLAGFMVFGLVNKAVDPCAGCGCPRDRCGGRSRTETV